MRFNAQTDLSLRLLMYLAAKDGGTATIQEASSRMQLSQTHLMRVAAKLVAKGFLASSRGRMGGISLAKVPCEITVEDVVRAVEPDFALVECFGPIKNACTIEPGCLLKGALAAALEAFFAELRAVSLYDLTQPNRARLSLIFQFDNMHQQIKLRQIRRPATLNGSVSGGIQ